MTSIDPISKVYETRALLKKKIVSRWNKTENKDDKEEEEEEAGGRGFEWGEVEEEER